jgi:hypothetical protein
MASAEGRSSGRGDKQAVISILMCSGISLHVLELLLVVGLNGDQFKSFLFSGGGL